MIHTKIHKLNDGYNKRATDAWADTMGKKFKDKPHYVLDPDLFQCLKPTDIEKTIDALLDADVLHTPYDECVVEMETALTTGEKVVGFVALKHMDGIWMFDLSILRADGSVMGTPAPGYVGILRSEPQHSDNRDYDCRHVMRFDKEREGLNAVVGAALCVLIVLSHTRGVAKEVVNADALAKLNKARKSRGNSTIPAYTVFKIGHTYNSAGNSTAWHPGTKMRPHLRAGHVRQQVCGAGRKDRKLIFVEPVLVNCDTTDNLVHVPKLVRA